jgi:hypothetical protein
MGDKSPKAKQKHSGQKQMKEKAAAEQKQAAIAAKQVVIPKK